MQVETEHTVALEALRAAEQDATAAEASYETDPSDAAWEHVGRARARRDRCELDLRRATRNLVQARAQAEAERIRDLELRYTNAKLAAGTWTQDIAHAIGHLRQLDQGLAAVREEMRVAAMKQNEAAIEASRLAQELGKSEQVPMRTLDDAIALSQVAIAMNRGAEARRDNSDILRSAVNTTVPLCWPNSPRSARGGGWAASWMAKASNGWPRTSG